MIRRFCIPLLFSTLCSAAGLIFPEPREIRSLDEALALNGRAAILVPEKPSAADLSLARLLTSELSDRYGLAIKTTKAAALPPSGPVIVMGTTANPLVKAYCARQNIEITDRNPGPEGYVLQAGPSGVLIAASDDRGAFYGLQSLRQLIRKKQDKQQETVEIRGVQVRDWPYKPYRAVKVYLPGRDNIAYFKRFVADFLALYKYNRVIIEMNAAMRLDRHPELNAGSRDLVRDLSYTRRERPAGPHGQFQDSANWDTADGGILEKREVAELVEWANQNYIEVIPEIPSLTHSYYLLTRHRELAEIADAEWPDTYCPSNPKSRELLFDVLDEYIEVMKPAVVHIGHDEWRMPVGVCPLCRGKDPRELFAHDVTSIHDYLAKKGVKTAMYADHLMADLRGERVQKTTSGTGFTYYTPGGLSPAQAKELIPKDILMFNWFWGDGNPGQGEAQDRKLSEWGFEQVHGNFTPAILNYARRSKLPGVIGGVPSSWAATTEFNIGKDMIYDFAGCASLLWSTEPSTPDELARRIQGLMRDIRGRLSGQTAPSEDSGPAVPVNLAAHVKAGAEEKSFNLPDLPAAIVVATDTDLPRGTKVLELGDDPSSIVFLHACAKPARNAQSYEYVYNFADTADLLGWYEVIYEDGLVTTVPIRYGDNILEWNWRGAGGRYCYRADPVVLRDGVTLFAYEWVNPRFGKAVKEVYLKTSRRFTNEGKVMPANAVILGAASIVRKRSSAGPARAAE